jgi:hypothetical protein
MVQSGYQALPHDRISILDGPVFAAGLGQLATFAEIRQGARKSRASSRAKSMRARGGKLGPEILCRIEAIE